MGAFRLRVVSGAATGMTVDVDREFVVGRAESEVGNLRGDQEISRRHARFTVTAEGVLLIEDLGSTNGTFVNGRRLTAQHVLHPGDQVKLGATTLEVAEADPVADPAATQLRPQPVPPPPPPAAAPGAFPARRPPLQRGRRRSPVPLIATGLVAAVILLALGYFIRHQSGSSSSSASSTTPSPTAAATAPSAGVVYVESNIAKPDSNSVLALRYAANGDLHPMRIAEYPTGGAGSADLTDSGVLDADQHLHLDPSLHLLFAVNQGSDTIAVFHVATDGSLTPVQGSPFPSGGMAPVSVGISASTAIVANKAQDGIRDLTKVAPSYVTFHINSNGSLTQFGPTIHALPESSPTDALVAPKFNFVMSTEEGGPLRGFILSPTTGLTQGANSPLQPAASIFPPSTAANERWGLGLADHPTLPIVYIGMATVDKIAVYTYNNKGALTFVRAVNATGADLPCWTHMNAAGTRLYTANAGNDTMSVFNTSNPMDPVWMQTIQLDTPGNPWDFQIDPSGKMIFLDDPRARMNVAPGYGQAVHTLLIGANGTLSEPSYSPAALPVAINVNPIGLAVTTTP